MNEWIVQLSNLNSGGQDAVLVTVAGIRGSAPRETGAKMVVTERETIGSIGGGQLEYQCTRIACEHLRSLPEARVDNEVRKFALGANCGQCCGGVVDVLFEPVSAADAGWLGDLRRFSDDRQAVVMITPLTGAPIKHFVGGDYKGNGCPAGVKSKAQDMLDTSAAATVHENHLLEPIRQGDFHVAVFGAGHVGAATVDALSRLDCSVRWVDNRRGIFPATLPGNVVAVAAGDPTLEVAAMSPGSYFLVMTHSHPLDREICERILRREDYAYCGLIGSESKRRRFERLMKKEGLPPQLLSGLTCPIGVPGIKGKKPAEIALAVAAELLQIRDTTIERTKWKLTSLTG